MLWESVLRDDFLVDGVVCLHVLLLLYFSCWGGPINNAARAELFGFVPVHQQWMRDAEGRHQNFRGWVGFSVPVSHKITAGADILLMPSRFEPCGLNQVMTRHHHCYGNATRDEDADERDDDSLMCCTRHANNHLV